MIAAGVGNDLVFTLAVEVREGEVLDYVELSK
jgi:hypothetical protein